VYWCPFNGLALKNLPQVAPKNPDLTSCEMVRVHINGNTAHLGKTILSLAQTQPGIEDLRTSVDGRGSDFVMERAGANFLGGFRKAEPAEHRIADLKLRNPSVIDGKRKTHDHFLSRITECADFIGQIREKAAAEFFPRKHGDASSLKRHTRHMFP
jgi:hypothetical protein